MKAYAGSVHGRVQGVGFRYFVQAEAETRGLSGWVRNSGEDSVEFFVQGEESELAPFFHRLENGPPMARVDKFLKRDASVNEKIIYFSITH